MAAQHDLTDDAFLNGDVRVYQPRKGYRAGMDAVMLAASIQAREGEHVCDLGSGVGTAALCLNARVNALNFTCVEIDPGLAHIAERNMERSGLQDRASVLQVDILQRPRKIPRQHFHHVMSNPPFYDSASGTAAPISSKAVATAICASQLEVWLKFARALVRPKGTVTVILPPAQLALALSVLTRSGLGAFIIPLWPKRGADAKRLILRVHQNSNAPLRLSQGLTLHRDDGRPTAEAEQILRDGAPLHT